MVRKKEGVGFGLELHKTVVFKILKLVGALVEPLEDTNVTILVSVKSVEGSVRAEVEGVIFSF